MDAPPPIPPPPRIPPAGDDAAAGPVPAGARCGGCAYPLMGLDRAGVCPECGLDVAASLAAWDRGAGHPLYARRLRGEAMAMLWVAVWLAVVPVLAGVVGVLLGQAAASDPHFGAGYGVLMIAGTLLFLSATLIVPLLVMLVVLWRRLGGHGSEAPAHGAAERTHLRGGCVVLGAGLAASWMFAFLFIVASNNGAVAPGVAGLVVAFIAAVFLCGAGMRSAELLMPRSKASARMRTVEALATILAMGGLVLVPVGAWGAFAWWLAAAVALAGLVMLACALIVQSIRAIRVLDACAAGGR